MSSVFISYAKEDAATARRLAEALQKAGFAVWWDRHIPPGKTWDDVIGRALNSAACVIVLWSGTSVGSRWVREEAERAASRNCLIPVLIEKVEPPFGFARIQAADLSEWHGEEDRAEFKELAAAVADLVQTATQPFEPPVKPVVAPAEPRRRALWIGAGMIAAALVGYGAWIALRPAPVKPRLPAPQQITPASGTVLRGAATEAVLQWSAVPMARSYSVEHAVLGPRQTCVPPPPGGETISGIRATNYTLRSTRSQPGCWRVWAIDEQGNEGARSPWWQLTLLAQPPPPAPVTRNWVRLVHRGAYVAKFYVAWEGQAGAWQSGTKTAGWETEITLPPNVQTVRLNAQEHTGFNWRTVLNQTLPVQRTYTLTGTTLHPGWNARPPL